MHGSPRRINEYLFEDRPETAMARMADEYPYPAIFFGHTHVPYARPVGETDLRERRQRRPSQGRRLARLLRDRRPGASWAMPGFVEFVRVPYDYERLQRELAATPLITSFAGQEQEGLTA